MKVLLRVWILFCLFNACVRRVDIPRGSDSISGQMEIPVLKILSDSCGANEMMVRVLLKTSGKGKLTGVFLLYSMEPELSEAFRDTALLHPVNDTVYEARFTGLIPGTDYVYQAVASNESFTGVSEKVTVMTRRSDESVKMRVFIFLHAYDYLYIYENTEGEPDSVGLVWGTDPYVCLNDRYASIRASREDQNLSTQIDHYEYGQVYYCRSFAIKDEKVYYSDLKSVWCDAGVPGKISTSPVCEVSDCSARTGYMLREKSSSAIKRMGVCWGLSPRVRMDSLGQGSGFVTGNIKEYGQVQLRGLSPSTTYYARAFVENESGYGYGEIYKFTTRSLGASVNCPWKRVVSLPDRVNDVTTLARCGDKLFIFCEEALWEYTLSTGEWFRRESMPGGTVRSPLVVLVDTVFYCSEKVISVSTLWKYDVKRQLWEKLPNTLPEGMIYSGVFYEGFIYYKSRGANLWKYDIRDNTFVFWGENRLSNVAEYLFIIDDVLYVGGGTVLIDYPFRYYAWNKRADNPFGVLYAPFVTKIDSHFYLFGGVYAYELSEFGGLPVILYYDSKSDKWVRGADCPVEGVENFNVQSSGYCVTEGGYVLCERQIWQYFPEEDTDSELITE